jgi:hypothetical protein
MNDIPFSWQEEGPLVEYLSRRFDRLAVELDLVQRPVAVCLVHNQTPTIEISSNMHVVGERDELGALRFAMSKDQNRYGLKIDVPPAFGTVTAIDKLVLVEEQIRVESGIVFRNGNGSDIVIVASARPFGLAISVPWPSPLAKFDPECDLEQYTREPMM